ncbi:MAG: efflux RND transporter periplasmic adaptor subunit [Rikenellaceae bacterium]
MMKKKIIISAIIVAVAATAAILLMPKKMKLSDTKWITTTVSSQSIVQSITATGTVEPVTLVDVGTQVSGILTNLYVDYNSEVKKGQVIAELDKSTLLLDRNSSRNSVAVAQSTLTYQESNFKRVEALYKKGLIADSEYDLALFDYECAKNNLSIAQNTLARAEINLGYATIYSPIDGVIISRSVEEGQTVASSFSTPTLFTVAADLKDMRVIVDVDEADIGNIEVGQRAQFTVDAFPLDTFEGEVTEVRQEAIVESNVTTYEVVVSAANPDLKLKPGLTASIEIFTLDVECQRVVSAAALTFTPPMPQETPEQGEETDRVPMEQILEGDVVWIYNGQGRPEPCAVTVGVSNGILTEIIADIAVGTELVTGMDTAAMPSGAPSASSGESNPFLPQRPGK